MNTHVRDNLNALRTGGIAIGSQGANEIIFASSSSQFSRSSSFTYDGTAFLCATGSITASASEANNTVGAAVTSVLRVVNTNTGAAGRVAEIHFGITATGKYAAISGSLTDASNNTAGGIKFSTRQATTDANLTLRGQITATGLWSWETAGTHLFTAASSTANRLDVINTTSGTGANAQARVTAGTTSLILQALSQAYTTGTIDVQAGVVVQSDGAGGMSVVASNAAGTIRFYPGGTTLRGTMHASGGFSWGNAVDPGANVFHAATLACDAVQNDTGLAHGTTTPTATSVTNLTGTPTVSGVYMRVGNTVTISGYVSSIDPTAAGACQFRTTLPVASNLNAVGDLNGTGVVLDGASAFIPVQIVADGVNNAAQFNWTAVDATANQTMAFHFTYVVI